jgi:riboflavin biosynthesis pyrimidine reductase
MDAGDPGFLRQTAPVTRDLPETASEDDLRSLYGHAPHTVRLGLISAEGGWATAPGGSSRPLGGVEDRRVIRVLRAAADVVLVGAGTARREEYGPIVVRPALVADRAPAQPPEPLVAVVSATGNVPAELGPGTSLLITAEAFPAARRAREWGESLIVAGRDGLDAPIALAALAERGLTRVLCEGGPALARVLLEARLVSDYCLTTSPRPGDPAGPRVPDVPESFELAHTLEGDGFTMRRWVAAPA